MPRSNKKKGKQPTIGGLYKEKEKKDSLTIQRAINSARRHGLLLKGGRKIPGDGNCAFQAPIANVNDRSCFNDKYCMSSEFYRRIWTIDMEERTFNSGLNPGMSRTEWNAGWNLVRQTGIYEVGLFGDLIIPAISCGLSKILLIFNTNVNSPREPVSVINPRLYGVEPNSPIPIILAYNLVHYESLHTLDEY